MAEADTNSRVTRLAIMVIAATQFVNVVDFMMVMPLGPDFAKALGIRVSHMGVMSGAYTLAAAVSGMLGSFFLDRLDRRTALMFALIGLAVGTGMGAFAFDFHSLLWARVLAGTFGGPATSIGLSIISDLVPHERRGTAISKVMLGFSVASIFGVPMGLEVARIGGWSAPFVMVGIAAALMAIVVRMSLPSMRGHLRAPAALNLDLQKRFPLRSLLRRRSVWNSYGLLFCVMMSGFLLFPNIAAFVQFNLSFPRDSMGQLYFIGGIASLVSMSFMGKLVDRWGSVPWFILGSIGFMISMFLGMFMAPPMISPYSLFIGFMVFGTCRNISMQTLSSKVPKPDERAGFMSLQSSVQHTAMAFGGIASSRLLETGNAGELLGVENIVFCSAALVIIGGFLVVTLARQVRAHEH
jgi:predicted MFS family arabinose efflux permease